MSKTASCAIRKDPRFSKTQRKLLDVLTQARALVRLKRYWTRGVWGELSDGSDIGKATFAKDYAKVCKVCAEGAVFCVARQPGVAFQAIDVLNKVARDETPYASIVNVNDSGNQKATVEVFTKAIKLVRKGEHGAA